MKFDKVRFRYLYSNYTPKHEKFCKFDSHSGSVQRHPHTAIAVKVNAEKGEIHYAIARRDSNGLLLALKKRMHQIRALGGIVPEVMIKSAHNFPKDYSKATARAKALLKLEKCPHVISGVDVSTLNAHTITKHVMMGIIGDADFDYSLEVLTAAESATDWMRANDKDFDQYVLQHMAVKPEIGVDLLNALDEAASFVSALSPELRDQLMKDFR